MGNIETPTPSRTHGPRHSPAIATACLHPVCVQTSSYLLRRGQLSCGTLPLSGRTRDLEEMEDKGGHSEQREQRFRQVLTRVPPRVVKGEHRSPLSPGTTAPHCLAPLQVCFVGRTEKKWHEKGAGSREGVSQRGAQMRRQLLSAENRERGG